GGHGIALPPADSWIVGAPMPCYDDAPSQARFRSNPGCSGMAARTAIAPLLALLGASVAPLHAGDCNGNGVDDAVETAPDRAGFALRWVTASQHGFPAPLILADRAGGERIG